MAVKTLVKSKLLPYPGCDDRITIEVEIRNTEDGGMEVVIGDLPPLLWSEWNDLSEGVNKMIAAFQSIT